ncbi:microtubule organization protein AKNA [Apus apus]|uniref:microtubule organization protein AKNA n=1 Tax=Apus apus TaxID=8895 RepID=UPI0021F84393|nr:microtubule organization protein AKNA [Apus apus]
MASPAPWLRWTQTELRLWEGEEEEEEEEGEEEDDFERRMDEDGVVGLGSPPSGESSPPRSAGGVSGGIRQPGSAPRCWCFAGDGEDPEEGSPAEEGLWHPRRDLGKEEEEKEEERGSSGGDEGPWGVESDGEPYPELSDEGQWGSGSSDSPGTPGGGRALRQPRGCSTDGGDTSAPSDTSPGPATPSRRHRGWGRSQVPKKAAPTKRPPKPGRRSPSLSPGERRTGSRESRDPSGTGTGAAEGTQYGRGRLNHPLPDLSKVGARVKIDQSYRPPRSRALPARPRAPARPLGFKSPAEIVREVLLSSGEGVPPQPPSTARLPQEFRSPRQATELVQQLQDDYHKLLTKYAEAENTIDQLRLGARVSLYADPPRPSHSLAMGTVATGCQVVALNIPQARTAAFSVATAPPSSPSAGPAPGASGQEGSPQFPSPSLPTGGCPTCPGPCLCLGTQLTGTLAGQTYKLQAQVESFEGWIRAGGPTHQEQLQRFRKLKDAQDALEQAYLRARQQHPGASGDFDPDRSVEGEIFHLGLRLEELKEQLELGARLQPPLQPPAQPHSPPDPSPLLAAHSPHPESPVLMEGPQGTVGDSEEVTGGLPQPLWRKQLQVEEDFGDLLAQYEHFKSLPESLSLEQLSLAESGSQEEVDGPTAGDGGPCKVPYRTRSLEEAADLETSPLHPLERRAAPLSPREPPWPGGTRGHPSPTTAEDPPATAKPPLGLPEPLRVPLSHRSSGVGSAAPQHCPRKEQRIVSPETDSGFMGSEASRVSPPVHTPEHRPPGTGTPGSLGPSVPIPATLRPPRKREVAPVPFKAALMGISPAGGQGEVGGPQLPPHSSWQGSSPPRWAESAGSEVGPDGDGAHTDTEVEGRSCGSTGGRPPTTARGPASPPPSLETPSPTPVSPDLLSLDPAHCDLLGSRLERDQAIRELQDEVWRLRQSLEQSLEQNLEQNLEQSLEQNLEQNLEQRSPRRSRSHPRGKATLARRQPVASKPLSPKDTTPSGEPSPPVRGRVAPKVASVRRGRSASLPRDRAPRDPNGGLRPTGSHPASLSSAPASGSDPSPTRPRATPSRQKSPGGPPGVVTFRGQYTGTRYQAGMPRTAPAPQEELGTPGCPQCHRTPSRGSWVGDAARQPWHSTPRKTRCPTCQASMSAPAPSGRDGATHAERGPRSTFPPGSHVGPHAEKPEQPGLWYFAASPGATSCLAPVPLVPYVPTLLYCSPAVPTSAPATAGVSPQSAVGHRQAEHPPRPPTAAPHHCLALEELEELNWSLSRAVEAAQSMKVTTSRMSRALATELGRARHPRGSCLF